MCSLLETPCGADPPRPWRPSPQKSIGPLCRPAQDRIHCRRLSPSCSRRSRPPPTRLGPKRRSSPQSRAPPAHSPANLWKRRGVSSGSLWGPSGGGFLVRGPPSARSEMGAHRRQTGRPRLRWKELPLGQERRSLEWHAAPGWRPRDLPRASLRTLAPSGALQRPREASAALRSVKPKTRPPRWEQKQQRRGHRQS